MPARSFRAKVHGGAKGEQEEFRLLDIRVYSLSAVAGEGVCFSPDAHLVYAPTTPHANVVRIDGGKCRMLTWKPGDFAFLPAGMRGTASNKTPHDATLVQVPASRFASILGAAFDRIEVDVLVRSDPIILHCVSAMACLAKEPSSSNLPLLVDSITVAMTIRAAQLLLGNDADAKIMHVSSLTDRRLRRVLDYIEERLGQPMRLAEIASVAAMSEFHFARMFRRRMGMTPLSYVWRRRVERAKILLQNPNFPISAVAMACGFAAQSHFTTVFKRLTGMTPSAYRREALK